ncbi:DNA-binding response regulator [Marinifilum breve]|uniref:DNA-binding response regulator n=1 Tax=Marinifilum breve TaxID=2184082 RepID=A0A2V3ZYK6_9BACT|nr:response regulator transcription factor [Marinifilum breve]PXY00627.1 DNA-binding response regulator [Marinifilum breve]
MKELKILFVDDDIQLGNFVSSILESDYKYRVHFQNSLISINSIIESLRPDILILDVEIGKENGIDHAVNILEKYPKLPILFVSSHTEDELIIKGMNTGGNAYLTKPFSIPVLVSYIKRFTEKKQQELYIERGNYRLNLVCNDLFCNDDFLKKLSPFEKNALELMMKKTNEIVSKEELAQIMWKSNADVPNVASLHNTISKLRDLFKDDNSVKINTIRGVGYILSI